MESRRNVKKVITGKGKEILKYKVRKGRKKGREEK